jgi:hypothetical protein
LQRTGFILAAHRVTFAGRHEHLPVVMVPTGSAAPVVVAPGVQESHLPGAESDFLEQFPLSGVKVGFTVINVSSGWCPAVGWFPALNQQ